MLPRHGKAAIGASARLRDRIDRTGVVEPNLPGHPLLVVNVRPDADGVIKRGNHDGGLRLKIEVLKGLALESKQGLVPGFWCSSGQVPSW